VFKKNEIQVMILTVASFVFLELLFKFKFQMYPHSAMVSIAITGVILFFFKFGQNEPWNFWIGGIPLFVFFVIELIKMTKPGLMGGLAMVAFFGIVLWLLVLWALKMIRVYRDKFYPDKPDGKRMRNALWFGMLIVLSALWAISFIISFI
jgi:hypothetical protein